MSDQRSTVPSENTEDGPRPPTWLERHFEALLFGSRWIAAPIYLGLVFGLVLLLTAFFNEIRDSLHLIDGKLTKDQAVLWVLDSIDVALVANLLLIVVLAGYEHFVSKIDTQNDEDRPGWMGTVDFSGIKLKLFASIIGLTGIEILKAFMNTRPPDPGATAQTYDPDRLKWMLIIHATFLFTALLSSIADWLASKTESASAETEKAKAEASLIQARAKAELKGLRSAVRSNQG
jgi:uncharacterized protein (TIGR00645 family)